MIEDLGKTIPYQELGCLNGVLDTFDRATKLPAIPIAQASPSKKCPNTATAFSSANLQLYEMVVTDSAGIRTIVYQTCFDIVNLVSVWSRNYNRWTGVNDPRPDQNWGKTPLPSSKKIENGYNNNENKDFGWYQKTMKQAGYDILDIGHVKEFDTVLGFKTDPKERDFITRGHFTPSSDFDESYFMV